MIDPPTLPLEWGSMGQTDAKFMNMRKEYRTELRQNLRIGLKLWRDLRAYHQKLNRSIAQLQTEKMKSERRVKREEDRLLKRRAILHGRLN